MRLVVYASGRAIGNLLDSNGAIVMTVNAISSDLATSGTLEDGLAGLYPQVSSGSVTYDNFYAGVPGDEPFSVRSGESLQVRSDDNLRASADGTTYGSLPSRGSRLFIPPAGDAGRTSRIAVRATREDPVTMASRNDGDTTDLAVYFTPRYLTVPRGTA